ncbi:MAG: hypothetical protein ACI4J0_06660 [Huintestinicola sp.]|uniref:hypothetical protein n=1 Tax=Huintestinicola sp. TaxID=2981661 RepID=UPI003F04797C
MSKRARQYIGIISAVVIYYLIHEGAHLLTALVMGVFKQINFMGIGVQIDVFNDRMSDFQMGIFCLAGALASLLAAYILLALRKRICSAKSPVFRCVMYYTSITMLLLDPIYLSILCGFFGGGDMNGISLLIPEAAARIIFGVMLVVNAFVFIKAILPEYKASFAESGEKNENS